MLDCVSKLETQKHMKYTITLFLISLISHSAFAAVNALISGPVVGSGRISIGNPEQTFDQNGNSIIHPFANSFVDIYSELTGSESFSYDTGNDLPLGQNPILNIPYGDPAAPSGNGHWSGLIGINHGLSGALGIAESSQIGLAFRGFSLNPSASTDFFIDTTTFVETRIYRNGEVGIFDLSTNTMVYNQTGLIAKIFTDWNGGDTGVTPFDTDTEAGDIDVSIEGWSLLIDSYYSDSDTPVQVDGGTLEGDYAIFHGNGQVTTTAIPEPNVIYGSAIVLIAVFALRRRIK